MSIWSSLTLPEPIRDIDGHELDVARTGMHPAAAPSGYAVRIAASDPAVVPDVYVELSEQDAARLRDALTAALAENAENARRWREIAEQARH